MHLSRTLDGSGAIDGTLTPEGYAVVRTALRIAESPELDGDPVRTPAQRRHDALIDLCRHFLDHQHTRRGGRHRPHLNVIVNVEDLDAGRGGTTADGTVLDGPTIARLVCDSALHRVLMAGRSTILDYGTATRTTPVNLWNALVVRDHGCRWPGCDRPSDWCEAHHVVWASNGGPTRPGERGSALLSAITTRPTNPAGTSSSTPTPPWPSPTPPAAPAPPDHPAPSGPWWPDIPGGSELTSVRENAKQVPTFPPLLQARQRHRVMVTDEDQECCRLGHRCPPDNVTGDLGVPATGPPRLHPIKDLALVSEGGNGRGGDGESTYKRDPVRRRGAGVAIHLCGPPGDLGRAGRSPVWPCSGWGLPSRPDRPGRWCALTAPFHPYLCELRSPGPPSAVCSLLPDPTGHPVLALASILPCGVPTFLVLFQSVLDLLERCHSLELHCRRARFYSINVIGRVWNGSAGEGNVVAVAAANMNDGPPSRMWRTASCVATKTRDVGRDDPLEVFKWEKEGS